MVTSKRSIEIEGIVLSSIDFKESSKIIKVLAKKGGIISILAKGIKKQKSRKINLSETFVKANFDLTSGQNFYYLNDGEILEANLGLRKNISKIYLAYYFVELISKSILDEEEYSENFYLLLDKALSCLKEDIDFIALASSFILKLVSLLGYKPNLSYCSTCSSKSFEDLYFSSVHGGLICQTCHEEDGESIHLTREEYEYIVNLLYRSMGDIKIQDSHLDKLKIHRICFKFYLIQTGVKGIKTASTLRTLGIL